MATCTYEPWSIKDLSTALVNMNSDKKEIVVPIFQRGKRWKPNQEKAFIDSLLNGFPVGTMLFYRTVSGQREIYTLVDGLQRSNTIKKFMAHPTEYFTAENIASEIIDNIYDVLGLNGNEKRIKEHILEVFTNAIKQQRSFSGMQFYPIAREIGNEFPSITVNATDKILDIIQPYLLNQQNLFEKIEKTIIPVIVYTGQEETLPEIFERINSKGTPLSTYEIYAASWPINRKFSVYNNKIVEFVMRKYDSLADDEFLVSGYNRDEMRKSKMLNAFEYAFGFSKYICNEYPILAFDKKQMDDEINTLGFELLNGCLSENKESISVLFENILTIDVNILESKIIECIEFVQKVINPVCRFKGNSRKEEKLFHSKYQILSMIVATFKEKYDVRDLSQAKGTWSKNRNILQNNMLHHFVLDIIRGEWNDGGTGKLFTSSKPNKYINPVPSSLWETTLNSYYENSNNVSQIGKVSNPKKEDLVFLNCIYLTTFSALDQLSLDSFDVEHIATKDLMKRLIGKCVGGGLPISSIANLCYLPERVNRSKKDWTFYQDRKYLAHIELSAVEEKYSFTVRDNLEWTELEYNRGDYEALRDFYSTFLSIRFKKQKEMFYRSMGITVLSDDENEIHNNDIDEGYQETTDSFAIALDDENNTKPVAFHDECISKISIFLNAQLHKHRNNLYASDDKSVGVVVNVSKRYIQGNKDKYWFAYRSAAVRLLSNYTNKYVAFGCGSEDNLILFPLIELENIKLRLNSTENAQSIYWHIVFFKDSEDNWTWLLSKPSPIEVNINKKLVDI